MRPALILIALVALASVAPADVLRVGGFQPSYSTLQEAVDAAASGDTIVIFDGQFPEATIEGKGLTLVAARLAQPSVPALAVLNLPAGQTVRVLGLEVTDGQGRLLLRDCAGAVVLRPAFEGEPLELGRVVVENCDDVTLVDLEVLYFVELLDSDVALYDCDVSPWWGQADFALQATGGTTVIAGGRVLGADGPDTFCASSPSPGQGGARITGGLLVQRDCPIEGGDGGWEECFTSLTQGPNGPALVLAGASHQALPGPARMLTADSLVAAGGTLDLSVSGATGDQLRLVRGLAKQWEWRPTLEGVVHITPDSSAQIVLGTLGGTPLQASFPVPSALPNESVEVLLQLLVLDASGQPIAAQPFDLVVLNEAAFAATPRVHVDGDAPPGGDGMSWSSAFGHPADALTGPFATDYEVWVAEGTYPFQDTLTLPPGVALHGGFAGNETSLAERQLGQYETIFDGTATGGAPIALVRFSHQTLLTGCTVQHGHQGLRRVNGLNACAVEDCVIRDCSSQGVFFGGQSPARLLRCRFLDNGSATSGSGAVVTGEAQVLQCEFIGNTTGSWGGGLFLGYTETLQLVQGCRFSGNSSLSPAVGGGGLHVSGSGPGRVEISCCTFVGNTSGSTGGGLFLNNTQDVRVSNSIFWRNESGASQQGFDQIGAASGALPPLQYCCVLGASGTVTGPGNTFLDPRFVDMDGPNGVLGDQDDDLRLQLSSPLIDAGRNQAVAPDVADLDQDGDVAERTPFDLDGLPRFVDQPSVPDTGVGSPPLVDIGAYERQ